MKKKPFEVGCIIIILWWRCFILFSRLSRKMYSNNNNNIILLAYCYYYYYCILQYCCYYYYSSFCHFFFSTRANYSKRITDNKTRYFITILLCHIIIPFLSTCSCRYTIWAGTAYGYDVSVFGTNAFALPLEIIIKSRTTTENHVVILKWYYNNNNEIIIIINIKYFVTVVVGARFYRFGSDWFWHDSSATAYQIPIITGAGHLR